MDGNYNPDPDSANDRLDPSPSPGPLDYRPGPSPSLPQGEANEVPTQLQPRQPYSTKRLFTAQSQPPLQRIEQHIECREPRLQGHIIMSSHNDPNSSDEKAEETEMEWIRRRYAAHTSRLHRSEERRVGKECPV